MWTNPFLAEHMNCQHAQLKMKRSCCSVLNVDSPVCVSENYRKLILSIHRWKKQEANLTGDEGWWVNQSNTCCNFCFAYILEAISSILTFSSTEI
jgi:hypothetical protein